MSKKSSKQAAKPTLVVGMETITDLGALDDLLADVGLSVEAVEEVNAEPQVTEEEIVSEADLEAAVESLDGSDTKSVADTDETADPVAPVEAKPAKAKREKKAKETKAEKPKAAPKVYYGNNKVKRLQETINPDNLILTLSDAEKEGDELAKAQKQTLEIIGGLNIKRQNRATLLIEYAAGKSEKLNNVIAIALQTLAKDGKIVTGDKGNLHAALLAKPYGPSSARAMGNNTVAMLHALKVINAVDKQTFVPNPDSLLLSVVAGKMGLEFSAGAESQTPEVETEELVAA